MAWLLCRDPSDGSCAARVEKAAAGAVLPDAENQESGASNLQQYYPPHYISLIGPRRAKGM
jgi:hypothetical protein